MLTSYFSNAESVHSRHLTAGNDSMLRLTAQSAHKCILHTHWGETLATRALAKSCCWEKFLRSVSQEQESPLRWLPLMLLSHLPFDPQMQCMHRMFIVVEEKHQLSNAFTICHVSEDMSYKISICSLNFKKHIFLEMLLKRWALQNGVQCFHETYAGTRVSSVVDAHSAVPEGPGLSSQHPQGGLEL